MTGTSQTAPGNRGGGMSRDGRPDPATEAFVAYRNLLFTVAYEMLGSAADAEDVLQETWLRWAGVDLGTVRDQRAYLVRITTRQALGRLRTLGRRKESYVGPWLPEPLLTAPDVAEDVEQTLQIARFGRPLERRERVPGLGRGYHPARPALRDVRPRPVRDLADRGRAFADGFGDLVVGQVEHLAQHEHRPLVRREGLEHQQHRHRDAVGQFDVLGHVGRGQQGLGQPGADVGLLAAAERAQPDQRLPGGDPDPLATTFLQSPRQAGLWLAVCVCRANT